MTCAAPYNRVGTEELRLLMPHEDYSPAKKRLFRKGTLFTHPRKVHPSAQAHLDCESAPAAQASCPRAGSAHGLRWNSILTMAWGLVSACRKAGYPTGLLAAALTNVFFYRMIGWRGMFMEGPSASIP